MTTNTAGCILQHLSPQSAYACLCSRAVDGHGLELREYWGCGSEGKTCHCHLALDFSARSGSLPLEMQVCTHLVMTRAVAAAIDQGPAAAAFDQDRSAKQMACTVAIVVGGLQLVHGYDQTAWIFHTQTSPRIYLNCK